MAAETVGTFKIFVGNVPEGTTAEEIRKIFEEFGTVVECDCLGNKGFVHMEDDIEGKHAIGQLQGRTLNGQTLIIAESKKPGFARIPGVKLLVKNVSSTVDARGLRNMFKRFGYVLEVQLQAGEGHVSLEATGDIKCALKEMNGHVIDEVAMTVEPGPVVQPPDFYPSAKKMRPSPNYRGRGGRGNSWSSPGPSSYHQPESYEDDYDYRNDYDNDYSNDYDNDNYGNEYGNDFSNDYNDDYDQGPNPFDRPPPNPFHQEPFVEPPPERILRDPMAHMRGNRRGGRGQRFRGRGRGLPPGPPPGRMFPPPGPPPGRMFPPLGLRPPRGMRGMRMRPGMQRGGPPRHMFHPPPGHMFNPPPEERIPRDRFSAQLQPHPQQNDYYEEEEEEEQVFYEDEPIPTPQALLRMSLSGSNSVPVGDGDEGLVSRTPGPRRFNMARGGNAGRRGRGPGRGRGGGGGGRGRFTALTDDISPGEKYPVPPMHNPSFRAPMKWPKEEVKRKVKKIKKPLVPAELPDYSTPVPEIPNQFVPRGAVLKPFPPPRSSGISQVEFSLSNGSGNGGASSHMDFTSDAYY